MTSHTSKCTRQRIWMPLPRADFVIATRRTRPKPEGIWNAQRFSLMKTTAYFINIGRGKTMKIDDLADAVETGEIAGCGLDVFEVEPITVYTITYKQTCERQTTQLE